jgi:hypothetical protein
MPYKDPEAKRRYMSRYYEQKIKTGAIPCTAYRKRSYGLTDPRANKTQDSRSAVAGPKGGISQPISPSQAPLPSSQFRSNSLFISKPENNTPKRPNRKGGAEYKERIPRGFTSLGNGVVIRFFKPNET